MSGWMSMFCGLGMHANCGGHTSSGGACACQCHGSAERCSMRRDGVSHSARCHHDEHEVCDRVAEGTDAPKSCACPCHSPEEQ